MDPMGYTGSFNGDPPFFFARASDGLARTYSSDWLLPKNGWKWPLTSKWCHVAWSRYDGDPYGDLFQSLYNWAPGNFVPKKKKTKKTEFSSLLRFPVRYVATSQGFQPLSDVFLVDSMHRFFGEWISFWILDSDPQSLRRFIWLSNTSSFKFMSHLFLEVVYFKNSPPCTHELFLFWCEAKALVFATSPLDWPTSKRVAKPKMVCKVSCQATANQTCLKKNRPT